MSALQYPKIEPYDRYLYLILHGIDFHEGAHAFETHDVDFFLGHNFLVTVHDGHSKAIEVLKEHCPKNHAILSEGPVGLLHRIVDAMVDSYRPEIEELEEALDELEDDLFDNPRPEILRRILETKRDVAALRRVITPQRDVVGRLARREFVDIGSELAVRFRDVYDHLVRLNDEVFLFQDRLTSILEAHLSQVSNRLNEVMKVLTVITTIFMPLTLLSGLYGMNVHLPHFPGGEVAQFWWISSIMVGIIVVMLIFFRRRRWI
jgi:magnesium transporter